MAIVPDLGVFGDTPYGDEDALNDFLKTNADSHSAIAIAFEQTKRPSYSIPLTNFDTETGGKNWLNDHNLVHQQEFDALGLTDQPDLSEIDFKSKQSFDDWMYSHALIHKTIAGLVTAPSFGLSSGGQAGGSGGGGSDAAFWYNNMNQPIIWYNNLSYVITWT